MALTPVTVFFSYSHKDESFREQLETHLAILQRKDLIKTWCDRRIVPGQNWEAVLENQLDHADITLFLVSADFIASDYCYGIEVLRAMERHERNETKVIPIILRPVDWIDAAFGRLQALPEDGQPITSWANQDQAWLDVEQGIKTAIGQLQETKFRDISTSRLTSVRDVLHAEFKRLEKLYSDTVTAGILSDGLLTGIRDLDILLRGLRSSELIVIAGRPSFGKSDLLINILGNAAIGGDQPVAFFSLQMPAQQVIQRLIASTSGTDSQKLRIGYLGEKDFPRLAAAAGKLVEAPLYIDESPRLSISEIRNRAKSLKVEKEIRLLMIDSLQQVITNDISNCVVALKTLAKELQIPVLVTSNVSRDIDQRRDKRPVLADLGEWGTLEQEADVILFLYRDELYNPRSDDRNELDIIVAKNRNGPTGLIKTWYAPELSKICDSFDQDYYEEKENDET
jgi:replicative DNA helicase